MSPDLSLGPHAFPVPDDSLLAGLVTCDPGHMMRVGRKTGEKSRTKKKCSWPLLWDAKHSASWDPLQSLKGSLKPLAGKEERLALVHSLHFQGAGVGAGGVGGELPDVANWEATSKGTRWASGS